MNNLSCVSHYLHTLHNVFNLLSNSDPGCIVDVSFTDELRYFITVEVSVQSPSESVQFQSGQCSINFTKCAVSFSNTWEPFIACEHALWRDLNEFTNKTKFLQERQFFPVSQSQEFPTKTLPQQCKDPGGYF